ncbi:hypothetical protein [Dyella sp. OK004]|uniref:hypothetical protein n=1 Tax=Dyella sp. OK004 TaxID=1855292 RepID=UPI0021018DB8|nr:hypothetical protein [Dyella sp. OK004]
MAEHATAAAPPATAQAAPVSEEISATRAAEMAAPGMAWFVVALVAIKRVVMPEGMGTMAMAVPTLPHGPEKEMMSMHLRNSDIS